MFFIKKNKRWLILPIDCFFVSLAYYLSWVLRFDEFIPTSWALFPGWHSYLFIFQIHLSTAIFSFIFMRLYHSLWAYASIHDIYQIGKATLLSSLLGVTLTWLYNRMENIPRSTFVVQYILVFLLLSLRSFSWRILRELKFFHLRNQGPITLLIGINSSTNYFVRELRASKDISIVALLYTKENYPKSYIQSIPVLSGLSHLEDILENYKIQQVILTIKLNPKQIRDVYHLCEEKNIQCKTLPPFKEIISHKKDVFDSLRKIQLEDLLGRKSIHLETSNIESTLKGKNIFVSGAGGSIGRELCKQVLSYQPETIILFDISETALYEIDRELRNFHQQIYNTRIVNYIGDIKNLDLLQKIFYENDIQFVFHCAAYKHVPLMEIHPEQAISNNVTGTIHLAQVAQRAGIERFVMLSTDKAVNPANIMGASKRIAELYIQTLSRGNDTHFMSVRFGNVLGSQGSVIPLFKEQITLGGPVTVTHSEITRYFMTISEAVGLVIQAGIMGEGSEIFILDMGEPVKINDLAKDMILFAGLKPNIDIQIQYIGLRPGEKLIEELIMLKEEKLATKHKKIFKTYGQNLNLQTLISQIDDLIKSLGKGERHLIDTKISNIIPEYRPVHLGKVKR